MFTFCYSTQEQAVGLQWDHPLQIFHKSINPLIQFPKMTCHFGLSYSVSPLLSPAFPRSMKTGLLQLLHASFCNSLLLLFSTKKFKFIWHTGKAETLLFNRLFFFFWTLCNETPEIASWPWAWHSTEVNILLWEQQHWHHMTFHEVHKMYMLGH